MTNFETVACITDNMEGVLRSGGIRFARKTFDDERNIPAALLPLGEIFYDGESFADGFGERPAYGEAEYTVRVVIGASDPTDAMREQQRWAHLVRDVLTAANLNAGSLSALKPVSRVSVTRVVAENVRALSSLRCRVVIRYRETK